MGLLNVEGYYNCLLTFIDQAVNDGFILPSQRNIMVSASNARELVQKLEVRMSFFCKGYWAISFLLYMLFRFFILNFSKEHCRFVGVRSNARWTGRKGKVGGGTSGAECIHADKYCSLNGQATTKQSLKVISS